MNERMNPLSYAAADNVPQLFIIVKLQGRRVVKCRHAKLCVFINNKFRTGALRVYTLFTMETRTRNSFFLVLLLILYIVAEFLLYEKHHFRVRYSTSADLLRTCI